MATVMLHSVNNPIQCLTELEGESDHLW